MWADDVTDTGARRCICPDKRKHTCCHCLCLRLRLDVCLSMTVWVSCHQDWLCATVLEKVCRGMSSTVCLIKPVSHRQSILEVSYSLTPLDAARVTNPILYLFCLSPPTPVSLLVTMSLSNTYFSSSLYFWNFFFFFFLEAAIYPWSERDI